MATGDDSVLLLFDPLNSPTRSPTSQRTPGPRRNRDPQSPVAAFFSTVDKSKSLLETVKKKKEYDLIDLGQRQTPSERGQLRLGDGAFVTPMPLSKINPLSNGNGSRLINAPVFDPFSPPAVTPTYQSFTTIPQLTINDENTANSNLIIAETPAKQPKSELLVSTIFTPVPTNLPYLPNASFSSLYASSSTASTTRRRRSSIDLDKELQEGQSPDSSFDILRGELEIGTSADASFVSSTTDVSTRGFENNVEESPWTMRNTTMHVNGVFSGLTPVQEIRETSLLAHEIPLPDSPLTSPENSPIRNADASIHASKIFPNSRRFSIAPAQDSALQFPQESPEATSEKTGWRLANHPSASSRQSMAHTRTMSMTSVTSVGSTQSTTTVRNLSPTRAKTTLTSRRDTVLSNKDRRDTLLPNKDRRDTIVAAKKSPQVSPVSQRNSPSKASAARRVARPSIALKPTSRLSLIGTSAAAGPRTSIVPGPRASRASLAIAARTAAGPRGSIAPASVTTGLRAARPSIAPSGRGSMAPPPKPVQAQKEVKEAVAKAGTALTTGVRANTALRMPRPSIAVGSNTSATGMKKPAMTAAKPTVPVKARPSIAPSAMAPPSTFIPSSATVISERVDVEKIYEGERRRPRTSSAGAALISRPSIGTGAATSNAFTRPGARPALQRPKSVLNMSRM